MPIYEYKCRDCGKITEIFIRSLQAKVEMECPDCHSHNFHKIASSPAAVLARNSTPKGKTCCGQNERCDSPPCSQGGTCRRD